jgi:hypothetical protein
MIILTTINKGGRKIQNRSYRHAMCGLNPFGSAQGSMEDSCDQENKPLASMKFGFSLNYTSNYKLPKGLYAPCS